MSILLTPSQASRLEAILAEAQAILAAASPAPAPGPSAGLPAAYRWLLELGAGCPRTIEEALKVFGTKEAAGAANSQVIMDWAAETGLKAVYTADAIPWCGLLAAVICKRAGKALPKDPLWALNWAKFGEDVGQPGLGDILTFTREGGGHVGFYVGEDQEAFHVLGGNQSDAVTITRIAKTRLYRARRPVYRATPAAVKPYRLASTGAVSTNEA